MQSRLTKTAERKNKKQLILSLVGIIVILFVLFKYGIPALTNLSLFLSSKNSSSVPTTTSTAVVPPPILTQSFSATNSATISVDGTAQANQTIQLFVNDTLVDSKPTDNNGLFHFAGVNLTQQQNTIQAKARSMNSGQARLSDFSDSWMVAYLQKAPTLSIDNPHDNDSFDSSHPTVVVSGKTDPNIKVTVNGFWAIVDSNGNYSYTLSLQNGDNHIVVVATDAAGNTTTQQITVHHSQ